jgi:N-acetylmuramoyl-L-alanine amidase
MGMEPILAGSRGLAVSDVQQRLASLGLALDGDEPGVYGPETQSAVRSFQQGRSLVADGIVGEDTWSVLVEASFTLGDRLLHLTRPMLRGDDVRDLQRRLNDLGFNAGFVDGLYGTTTELACKEFQLNAGIAADGRPGLETIRLLKAFNRPHHDVPAFAAKERAAMRAPGRASLAGVRIMLDPSHGPELPGHQNPDGVAEHEITWAIAARVEGMLSARGMQVVLSRGPGTSPDSTRRATLANVEDVTAIISIHANGLRDAPEARGAAAYYFGVERYVSERGRWLAQLLVDEVCASTGTANCRIHAINGTLLRASRAPAVIIEPGFLTHSDEGRSLADPVVQRTVAEAITRAVLVWLRGTASSDSRRAVK